MASSQEECKSQPRVWATMQVGVGIELPSQLEVIADASGKDVRIIIIR